MSTRLGVPILAVLLTVGSANLARAAYCGAANYCHCVYGAGVLMGTAGVVAATGNVSGGNITTGATNIGTPTGLPLGVTASWAANTITIIGTPTVTGTFNYTIPLTGGCGTVNATGTITVGALPIISLNKYNEYQNNRIRKLYTFSKSNQYRFFKSRIFK